MDLQERIINFLRKGKSREDIISKARLIQVEKICLTFDESHLLQDDVSPADHLHSTFSKIIFTCSLSSKTIGFYQDLQKHMDLF